MGIFFFDAEKERHSAQIRPKVKKIFRSNLTSHNAMCHVAISEGGYHFGELTDFQPDDVVDQCGQRGIGLVLKGDSDQALNALGSGLVGEEERKRAIACDDAKGFEGRVHGQSYRSNTAKLAKWVK